MRTRSIVNRLGEVVTLAPQRHAELAAQPWSRYITR
jgi:hypothetical protein